MRGLILATSAIFAVAQLGLDTTLLLLAVGLVGGGVSLGVGLLIGLGGRQVASEIAAGRYLRRILHEGMEVELDGDIATVTRLEAASLTVALPDGRTRLIGYARLLDSGFVFRPTDG